MELFVNITLKRVENFMVLCTDFMCQGGNFTAKNGTGGESIYDAMARTSQEELMTWDFGILMALSDHAPLLAGTCIHSVFN
ncbi:hypothetical protein SUGI_1197470 [Cryptomeria japonica]|nr:hypothetical protein SUGI_1197470 [Cryptomeria japonica]